MRSLFLLFCAALPGAAQFAEIAATPDGAAVFFTTKLRERGTTQTSDPKLFHLGNPPKLVRTQVCDTIQRTGECGISELQVTARGLVYQSQLPCIGGSSCIFRETASSTLIRQDAVRSFVGRARLSRNGRYVANHDMNGMPGDFGKFARLIDLETNAIADLPLRIKPVVAVSDTGTVLSRQGLLATPGGTSQVVLPNNAYAVSMDAQARRVLWQQDQRICVTSIASGQTWQITPEGRSSFGGLLSDDGEWALHISVLGETPQLFFSRSDGTGWRQLTSSADGVLRATLTGDGSTAYAVTGSNAIVRIDTQTGTAGEVFVSAPDIVSQWGATVAGSLNILTGVGFDGARVNAGTVPVRLLYASPTELRYQLPWEAESGAIVTGRNPYLEAIVAPRNWPQSHAIVHGNWRSIVNDEDPATTGETIHIYATGFGRVDTEGRATENWRFAWDDGSPAEVLYLGLAPGFIGLYQMDVRVPALRYGYLAVNDGWGFATFPIR